MATTKKSTENLILRPGEEAEPVTLPGTGEKAEFVPLPNPAGESNAVPAQTGTTPQATAPTQASTPANNGWTPLNSMDRYGSVEAYKEAMKQEWANQQAAILANPELGQAATREQSAQWWSQLTPEQRAVTSPGGQNRTPGTSGADEDLLSDQDYAIVQWAKEGYANATSDEERAYWHQIAEQTRQAYGYSGGSDGSMYLTGWGGGGGDSAYAAAQAQQSQFEYQKLLEEWRKAATDQYNATVDYEVQRAVTALERALADAEPQFREQVEGVARDELQALDNSALYAEARGDRGGIGQSQYNEIQAQAANNRLMVRQAQTKLSTDTARQIEDLRAQGEFEKADAALEISQTYLTQLVSLEQWAAEFGLTERQFAQSVRQWEAEYQLAMEQFLNDQELSYAQMTGKFSDGASTLAASQYQQEQLSSLGYALLEAGIQPSGEQLAAMGMTESQAQAYLMAAQIGNYSSGSSKGSGSSKTPSSDKKKEADIEVEHVDEGTEEAADTGRDAIPEDFTVLENMKKNGASPDEIWIMLDSLGLNEAAKLSLAAIFGL